MTDLRVVCREEEEVEDLGPMTIDEAVLVIHSIVHKFTQDTPLGLVECEGEEEITITLTDENNFKGERE